ncbi:uncharacterized protein DUF3347 [Pedobacter psychrotolerans]|uniref:Uncharacterized protein DUF3347 n=1 Tax=Pedobacter psychrotolerans TaxID=1843235 RepID=A0A4V2RZB9_9SPHI|nr:DUF3347 domain-containing protein [Pedobacter psychrotolerans]TCO25105.1 uncharacterized protein DUF3347 [Pedobacter psychrotolerans]GGE48070.1 hypothetical protein GCM10011413_12700 [Pedobacter psychrotolerans]
MKQIFGIAILLTFIACNQSEKKSADQNDSSQADSISVSSQVSIKDKKKEDILIKYVNLKNALVKSDEKLTQKNAADLQKSLADFEGCEPTAEIAGKIASSGNLIDQRKGFTILSSDLIALMKNAEIEKGTIFVQHCPMANKGDGGDWLSTEKEIRNPYYGKEMLECGRVTEELKAN